MVRGRQSPSFGGSERQLRLSMGEAGAALGALLGSGDVPPPRTRFLQADINRRRVRAAWLHSPWGGWGCLSPNSGWEGAARALALLVSAAVSSVLMPRVFLFAQIFADPWETESRAGKVWAARLAPEAACWASGCCVETGKGACEP